MDGFVGKPEEQDCNFYSEPKSGYEFKMVDAFRHFYPTQTKAFTVRNTVGFYMIGGVDSPLFHKYCCSAGIRKQGHAKQTMVLVLTTYW